jgi:membrane protein required for colicin V production
MTFTNFDYLVLVIFGLSTLLGLFRGFIKEMFSLSSWFLALWLAGKFGPELAQLLPMDIPILLHIRHTVGYVGAFLVCLLVFGLLNKVLTEMIRVGGLTLIDRILGSAFGALRGVLIVMVMVCLGGLTQLPAQPVWQYAVLSTPLEKLVWSARDYLPAWLVERLKFNTAHELEAPTPNNLIAPKNKDKNKNEDKQYPYGKAPHEPLPDEQKPFAPQRGHRKTPPLSER